MGLAIYWGEGDSKPKNPLRISNTDPRMIKLYVRFLREIMKVPDDKIRLGLILYPDLDDRASKNYWSKITNLKSTIFVKSQFSKGVILQKTAPRRVYGYSKWVRVQGEGSRMD
ncbi:MAG: hypothetical protein M1361_01825 [Patescibacteria group bacterium]|nr:hypothetical protein [Patescibacteria group bacterium]